MKGSDRIPTPAEQSKAGKSGGKKKLDANAIEALWDIVKSERERSGGRHRNGGKHDRILADRNRWLDRFCGQPSFNR